LLNWAARYYPILRRLRSLLGEDGSVLEVGCGPFGLAYFYRKPMVGCDIHFPSAPSERMRPVRARAHELPFLDGSFDAVVASDLLEHVVAAQRQSVVAEALRVARKLTIFAFPFGPYARMVDEALYADLKRKGIQPPGWLSEHMDQPFPDQLLFEQLSADWQVETFGNEHVGFHDWLIRKEMSPRFDRVFRWWLKTCPFWTEALLRIADRPPYYRMIVVAIRRPETH
jgi:SAM-dependent methyltransferase